MLIRSQDKKNLINIAQTTNIAIISRDRLFKVMAYYQVENGYDCIGEYATEDKAIKVLGMIQAFYVVCKSMETVNGNPGKRLRKAMNEKIGRKTELFVFQVPTDEEVREDI